MLALCLPSILQRKREPVDENFEKRDLNLVLEKDMGASGKWKEAERGRDEIPGRRIDRVRARQCRAERWKGKASDEGTQPSVLSFEGKHK
jgi:hypothetical protein